MNATRCEENKTADLWSGSLPKDCHLNYEADRRSHCDTSGQRSQQEGAHDLLLIIIRQLQATPDHHTRNVSRHLDKLNSTVLQMH